jgi:hypothetical protein
MSQLTNQAAPAPSVGAGRPPVTLWVTTVLTLLLALVSSYGSIYFSFYFEDPDPGIGSWTFVAGFIAIAVTGAASAIAALRGSRTGWRMLAGYGVLGILWCIAKLVFWQEVEALVFGAVNLLILGMLFAPRTRRYVA